MPASVFFSYSHKDEELRDQIETQLSLLKRQGVIETWHDRRIGPGDDFSGAISQHVEKDDIILLLVSADFLASDYCYEIEMTRALKRQQAGTAIVIPVILRACDWHGAPFGKLLATPPDGKPIKQYADLDQGLLEVAKAVRAAATRLASKPSAPSSKPAVNLSMAKPSVEPRSSNLAVARTFTQRDHDLFRVESFDFMARFFENSLQELALRNHGIEGGFRRVDSNRFTAVIYQHGKAISRCTIFLSDSIFAGAIGYSDSETSSSTSFNEMLTVTADSHSLFLRSTLGSPFGKHSTAKLTQEGAAELYWGMLIRPFQPR